MRIADTYSHLNGLEHLLVHKRNVWAEIESVIAAVDGRGELRPSPAAIKREFSTAFKAQQWRGRRMTYWVADNEYPLRPMVVSTAKAQKRVLEKAKLTAIKRGAKFDFVKNRTAVEVRLAASALLSTQLFVNHHAFYMCDRIDVGIEIIPAQAMEDCLPLGFGLRDRDTRKVFSNRKEVPPVPLVLIAIAP